MKPTVYIHAVPLLRFRLAAYGLVTRPSRGLLWAALTVGVLGVLGLSWAHGSQSPVNPASGRILGEDCSLHAAHRG